MPMLQQLTVLSNTLECIFKSNSLDSLTELTVKVQKENSFMFNQLPKLTKLILLDNFPLFNEITSFRTNDMPHLEFLEVRNARLDNLTEVLGSLPRLKNADFEGNNFASAENLVHSEMVALDLCNNSLRGSFRNNSFPELQYLELRSNTFLDGFENNRLGKLKTLNLKNCGLKSFNLGDDLGSLEML